MASPIDTADPYHLSPDDVQTPPVATLDILKQIGPGLIVASAVVGTGELIATTLLGAENGFSLLWLVLLSCLVKVVVQNELGRYAIGTGETGLQAYDRVPGPRFRVSWVVWLWLLMQSTTLLTQSGMLAGTAEVFNRLAPALSILTWAWIIAFCTAVLLIVGKYGLIEKVAVGLVVCFTVVTVLAAFILMLSPDQVTWRDVLSGLEFQLPQGGLATVVAVFGITGVGVADLTNYPYWCIEKGYARYAGPRNEADPAWVRRARGWIRVMGMDVLVSMIVYTFATIAFYLLGAGILHPAGIIPEGTETIKALSSIYTSTLGVWSQYLFLAGAVAVLYSSLFAGVASMARVYTDFLALAGVFDRRNYEVRSRLTQAFSALLLLIAMIYYLALREPVLMVKIGGIAQAVLLPVVGFATIYLRYRHLPKTIAPKGWITLALWVSAVIMAIVVGYSILMQL